MIDLFPGIPDQFPGKRERQKSQISREFPSREFPGGNSIPYHDSDKLKMITFIIINMEAITSHKLAILDRLGTPWMQFLGKFMKPKLFIGDPYGDPCWSLSALDVTITAVNNFGFMNFS